MLTGENGILTQAQKSREANRKSEAEERINLVLNEWQIEKRKTNRKSFEEYLSDKVASGELTNVTENKDGSFTLEYKGEERKIGGPLTPVLKDGMQAITFASDGTETIVEDTSKYDWYSYEAQEGRTDTYNEETGEYGTSHWANAKLNDNYYVWIPRYAYKIYDTEGEEGYEKYKSQVGESYRIDVKFIEKDVTNDNVETEVGAGYIVHPAFKFDNKQLSGIWVGKYESSNDGSGNVKIIPNAISYANINVKTMFTKARTLSTENNDAHMLKNIEWGAVAYLTQSQYGRNGTEISVNQCEKMITGAGKTEGTNKIYESSYYSTDPTAEQQYNGKIGKLSSTTGNVYGVYDMSGGAYEYVAGCLSGHENLRFGVTGDNTYVDLYTNPTDYYNDYSGAKIGDATKETLNWNYDLKNFIYANAPVFKRGGHYGNSSSNGVFCFYEDYGSKIYGNIRIPNLYCSKRVK